MTFANLDEAKMFADKTGATLDIDNFKFSLAGQTLYKVFADVDEAKEFAHKTVNEHPEIECNIFNKDNKHITTISTHASQSS